MGETNLVLITAQKNVFLIGKGHSCSGFTVHLDEDLTFTVTVFLVCVCMGGTPNTYIFPLPFKSNCHESI